jgi:hypothetical protein
MVLAVEVWAVCAQRRKAFHVEIEGGNEMGEWTEAGKALRETTITLSEEHGCSTGSGCVLRFDEGNGTWIVRFPDGSMVASVLLSHVTRDHAIAHALDYTPAPLRFEPPGRKRHMHGGILSEPLAEAWGGR